MKQGTTDADPPAARSVSPAQFSARFTRLIFYAWAVPPFFGLSFLVWIGMFTPVQIWDIVTSPVESLFILGNLTFALWYFRRQARVIRNHLESPSSEGQDSVRRIVRQFPLAFWAVFLAFLALAPSSVMLSAEWFAGYEAQPLDWFRIHLVAVIVSIVVGLPIFYMIFDLFGQVLGGISFARPVLTIRTKVFLIGSLIPLLIGTLLVQYFWTRTGFFTWETLGVWLSLEIAAIYGTLILVRSFGQSLHPFERYVIPGTANDHRDPGKLVPASTDELGVLVTRFRDLLGRERLLREQLVHAQKLEAIGRLAGGVAHDFNNDLMAILGCAELMRDRLDDDDPNAQYADAIIDATNRSAGIAKGLLTFSRKRDLKVEPVDLNAVAHDFSELLERLMGESITVKKRICDGSAIAPVDRGQIEQALMNLCLNARDSMPDGGTLTIATNRSTRDGEDHVTLSVSDTGRGIDKSIQQQVFEPFFTTKEEGVGTGLGLPMVYGIVAAHGGSVNFDSARGAGTTFSIHLPVTDSMDWVPPADEARDRRGSETVLLAEDNPSVRDLLSAQLQSYGYHVIVAADGDEAFRRFEEHEDGVDVAILDLRMPNRGGLEVKEAMRRHKPELPVLLISGNIGSLSDTSADDPMTTMIQKPFSSATLVDHIRQLIDG